MDLNDIRSAVTLVSFLTFVWLMAWAWSRQRRDAFEEAAQLPFLDNEGESQ